MSNDFDTYANREKVRARRVLTKTETVITTNGVVTARQHDYVVERDVITDGQEVVHTSVLDNDDFNAKFKRVRDDRELFEKKYKEGYEEGWRACEEVHDAAETIVTDEPAPLPEQPDDVAPPVTDTPADTTSGKVRELPS